MLYDVESGEAVTSTDLSARYVCRCFYSPNEGQLQDYLIEVEDRLANALDMNLPF